jgi:long-chain fatty acid transport protein
MTFMSQLFPASPLRAAALAALCVAALPQSALATNGYFSHGYGVKSQAIAGVGIALPQDGLTAATNPAGTAFTGNRLDVGVNLFNPSRSAEITDNTSGLNGKYSADGRDLFLIPEFGYTRQINPQLSVGLAVYGNGGMNTSYDTSPFGFGGAGEQGKTKMNLEQLFISPSFAWKATPDHVFGAALNLAHQRFSIRGLTPFTWPGYSESSNNVHNQGTDTSNGVGVRLGWIGQIAPQWRLGATWASKIQGRFDKYKGLFAEQGGFDIPANYGVGVSWRPTQDWTLGLDYQVIELSDVKSVGNPLSKFATQQLGGSDGPGFGWKDVKVIKLGVIHQLNDAWTLRAGYSHATQPIPKSETFFNILAPGVVQDHLTAGFTWKASANSEWSAHYTHAFEKTVKGPGAIPANFGGGDANIRLKEDIVGVSYGWKF